MTPQIEAFLEMMAVERDASPHTLAAYARDLADAETSTGGLMHADAERQAPGNLSTTAPARPSRRPGRAPRHV